jgi:hypothetical protein
MLKGILTHLKEKCDQYWCDVIKSHFHKGYSFEVFTKIRKLYVYSVVIRLSYLAIASFPLCSNDWLQTSLVEVQFSLVVAWSVSKT